MIDLPWTRISGGMISASRISVEKEWRSMSVDVLYRTSPRAPGGQDGSAGTTSPWP